MAFKAVPAVAIGLLLMSCSAPPPGYAQPTESDVRAAYEASIDGKIASWTPGEDPSAAGSNGKIDTPGEMLTAVDTSVRFAKHVGGLEALKGSLRSFAGVKMHGCEWGDLDLSEIEERERPANVDAEYAYRCEFEKYHLARGSQSLYLAYRTSAYLYKSGESFFYIPITAGPSRYAKDGEVSA